MSRRVVGEKRYLTRIQRSRKPPEGFPFGLKELEPDVFSDPQTDGASSRTREGSLVFDGAGSLAAALLRQSTRQRP